jgi:hypothetical protein
MPFKRALYPPDAAAKGKTPSTAGDDIKAVQRAVARAGFREWGSFTQDYTNQLSHGYNHWGGVQGFQADHVDLEGKAPTGWYGSKTHEALRCFVLPDGPHAGEFAFDQTAVNLYNSA